MENLTKEKLEQIKSVVESFEKNQSGQIEVKEIKKIGKQLGVEFKDSEIQALSAAQGKKIPIETCIDILTDKTSDWMNECEKIFKLFDHDKTGGITLKNLKRIRKILGEDIDDEDLEEMIDETDFDDDGVINMEEFMMICTKINEI